MTRCRFWYAYQIGDKGRYSFKLHGQFKQGFKVGDEVQELFDGKQIVYRVVTVDYNAKIYGVNYLHEIII
jgi:hypothetical protein